jgi:hypothetical protein
VPSWGVAARAELIYRGPDGQEVVAPTESFVRERLIDGDLSYWEGPAGDAVVFRQGGGEDASITLMVAAEGVILHFRDYVRREDVVLAHDPGPDVVPERADFVPAHET